MKAIVDTISTGDDFLIATHVNPDGDALGSAIALGLALRAKNKNVIIYDRDGIPDAYSFLPQNKIVTKSIEGINVQTLILVDCNNPTRAGLNGWAGYTQSLVIDHHDTDGDFGDLKFIAPDIPATGIIILRLIRELGVELTTDMAQNLYTAIALDTGTFRFANTTAEALRAGAELTEAGANPGLVADRLYNNWSKKQFTLFQKIMGALEISGDICFMNSPVALFKATSTTLEDTENFVNFPLVMDNIKVSVFMKESDPGMWRASLRSKGDINVAAIAEKLGGGGHKNASGCTVMGSYKKAKSLLLRGLKSLTK